MKKEPFCKEALLPPALVRLAAVLLDIAKNDKNDVKASTDDEANSDHTKEARNAENSPRDGPDPLTRRHLATTIGADHYRRQMGFIRERRRGNRTYYYLVENRREGKKVRQKVLKYLGTKAPEGWQPKKKEGR